jgi:heme/copper-type cytochrome/quinol oxidase subunit 2
MNNDNFNEYNRLLFEDNISIIFIIVSLINIKANNIVEDAIITNNYEKYQRAITLYKINIIITILVYIYFIIRNVYFYNKALENNENPYFEKIRVIGSVLILIGTLMLAYTLFSDENEQGEVEI